MIHKLQHLGLLDWDFVSTLGGLLLLITIGQIV
jgi:hypothetical protein